MRVCVRVCVRVTEPPVAVPSQQPLCSTAAAGSSVRTYAYVFIYGSDLQIYVATRGVTRFICENVC